MNNEEKINFYLNIIKDNIEGLETYKIIDCDGRVRIPTQEDKKKWLNINTSKWRWILDEVERLNNEAV